MGVRGIFVRDYKANIKEANEVMINFDLFENFQLERCIASTR